MVPRLLFYHPDSTQTLALRGGLLPSPPVLAWSSWCQVVQGAPRCLAAALHSACATSCANRRTTSSSSRPAGWTRSVRMDDPAV